MRERVDLIIVFVLTMVLLSGNIVLAAILFPVLVFVGAIVHFSSDHKKEDL